MNYFFDLFEHNPVPTLLWRKNKIENCNPAALQLFQIKSLNKLNGSTIFSEESSDVFEDLLLSADKNGSSKGQVSIKSSPELVPVFIHKFVDGVFLINLKSPISTENIPNSEAGFQSIVENSHDVIMQFDRQHRHLYVNRMAEVITNIPVNDFIGKSHQELGFPDYLCELWGEAIDKVFESGQYHHIEFTLPNGVNIDWSLVPELNKKGEVVTVATTARDITQIKAAQKEMLSSQTKFKDAFELARLATWETDLTNSKVILNPEFCSIVGLSYDPKNTILPSSVYFNDFVHDTDKEVFMNKLHLAINSRDEDFQDILSYRVNRPDGSMIWLLATIRLSLNNEGLVQTAYGTCQDITSIKNTERELEAHRLHLEELVEERTLALQQSENKLKDAINLAKLSTWEYDAVNELLRIEGLLERKLDRTLFDHQNYLKLDRFIDAIYPEDYKLFYSSIEKSIKTSDRDYYDVLSFRIFDINNEIHHVNLTIKVSIGDDNKVTRIYGTIQDFTHIVQSRIANERLTSIIEATSDIVVIINSQMEVIYLNRAGLDFYGIELNAALKIPIQLLQSATSLDVLKDVWPVAFEKGYWIGENKIRRHDELEVPVSQVIIAHKLENGDLDCYSSIIRDISKQKKTEEDLIYKNNELDTFVYRASHDLRGPIASMIGLYNVVKHEVNDRTALEFFSMYNDQILRLNEVIVALIDLTRIKEKDAELEPVNFEEIINGTIKSFTHLARFEKIRFRIKIDFNHEVKSDKSLITTIIQNLIENAIKYSRTEIEPFVNIQVKLMNKTGKGIIIKVQDNGIGIEDKIRDKIFNMFFRGSTDAIGSGLGLYILKNAVDKLHGRILLASRVNKGTLFKIELPFS